MTRKQLSMASHKDPTKKKGGEVGSALFVMLMTIWMSLDIESGP